MPDINNANLQSGSLGDELKVATGLIFGASDAEASDSGADSRLGPIPVLVHVVMPLSHIEETSPGGREVGAGPAGGRG